MRITIPFTLPTSRADGTALAATEVAAVDFFLSTDNGLNYASVGHAAPDQTAFTVDLTDPGTYLFRAETVDTQIPPRSSVDSNVVSFTVPTPPLAAPSPPVLGAVGMV